MIRKRRLLIGGPANSGKSTFALSLAEHLRIDLGLSVEAIEFDVWSSSYPAFRGDVDFKDRPKRSGLDWDWKTPLDERIRSFNACSADLVFGDMPGHLDEATERMCERADADGAIIITRTLEGFGSWSDFFRKHGLPVVLQGLTFRDAPPHILVGLNRNVNPEHGDVVNAGRHLLAELIRR